MKVTNDDHLIFLGSIQSEIYLDSLQYDIVVRKFNKEGDQIWSETYVSTGNDIGVQVIPATDGGFWVLKNTQPNPTIDQHETRLIKTDANGNLVSETTIGQINDVGYDMIMSYDNQLIVMGYNANNELYVTKIDEAGIEIWRQDYTSPDYYMEGRGMIEDDQHHIIIAGIRNEINNGNTNAFIAKLSPVGIPLWEREYGYSDTGNVVSMILY